MVVGCTPTDSTAPKTENPTDSLPTPAPLTAEASEPRNFGWMQGFPPAKDVRLSAGDGSFFRFPALRWSVVHMRELLPTIAVPRGLRASQPLPYRLDANIDSVSFVAWGDTTRMSWSESLSKNYTDGIVVLHRGRIVYERYFGELTEEHVHAVMSLSKSFTGTLAAVLVAEGKLDENQLVSSYLPELQSSAFGDATVRQVMDMTTALRYSENYADPNAEIWAFSMAGNPLPKPAGYVGPEGYFEYLQTVQKEGRHGEAFGYRTVNTDVLGWIVSRITNQKLSSYLSDRVWKPLAMEQDAYYQVDGLGTPFAGGGLNAGLRDLARFGELIRQKGVWNGQQIIPAEAVEDIMKGGDREAFKRSPYVSLAGWSYRNMWWMTHNEHGSFAARGVHGQTIYIDPRAEMVLVRLASHPLAGNAANDPYSLPAYHAVAKYLLTVKKS
jgi:CubicO group peptidase (beta-lactamase class C family)